MMSKVSRIKINVAYLGKDISNHDAVRDTYIMLMKPIMKRVKREM